MHTSKVVSGSIDLAAGKYYDFRVQYGQLNDTATFKMGVNPPGSGITYDLRDYLFESDPGIAGGGRKLLAEGPATAPGTTPFEASLVPSANVYIVASVGGPLGNLQPINGTTGGETAPAGAPEPVLSGAAALKAEIGADLEALKNQFAAVVMPIKSNNPTAAGLWNALMLAGICIGAVVVLHILLRAAVIWRKIRMPEILLWPAPELMIVGAFIPLVVAAAARKFRITINKILILLRFFFIAEFF